MFPLSQVAWLLYSPIERHWPPFFLSRTLRPSAAFFRMHPAPPFFWETALTKPLTLAAPFESHLFFCSRTLRLTAFFCSCTLHPAPCTLTRHVRDNTPHIQLIIWILDKIGLTIRTCLGSQMTFRDVPSQMTIRASKPSTLTRFCFCVSQSNKVALLLEPLGKTFCFCEVWHCRQRAQGWLALTTEKKAAIFDRLFFCYHLYRSNL